MADKPSKEVVVKDEKTVTVEGYTRRAPTMHGFKKVTVTETRKTVYEK